MLVCDINPHESKNILLDVDYPEKAGWGLNLNISLIDRNGFEVAFRQHCIPVKLFKDELIFEQLQVKEDKVRYFINGDEFNYIFNKRLQLDTYAQLLRLLKLKLQEFFNIVSAVTP